MYRGEEFIRFERVAQPWLKEAAKRWARMRLLADTSPRTMSAYLVGVRHFSEWLAEPAPQVSMPAGLSRAVLEDYMLWVRHESPWKPATRNRRLLAVRLLLEEQREDGLAGLPAGAVIHGEELPRVDPGLPKTLPGEVFAQWIDPANLALLDERDRTIVLVLAFCGFRVSSVVTLTRDCVELGSDGHSYLRYFNVKASREAMQHQAETRRLLDKARKNARSAGGPLMGAEPARRPLAEAAAQRTLEAEQRVHSELRGLDSDGATVTFAAVAERARVSRAFLYQHAELRSQIEALRSAQAAAAARVPVRQRASDASLRGRLRAALEDGQRQREEIARLRDELALAHGRARELELDRRLRRT